MFKASFLDYFFPLELREAKAVEFMNLKKGGMSVNEYTLKFTKLSKLCPSLHVDSRACMKKFTVGVSFLVKMECKGNMLVKEMDISV